MNYSFSVKEHLDLKAFHQKHNEHSSKDNLRMNRRSFLVNTAAATALASLPGSLLAELTFPASRIKSIRLSTLQGHFHKLVAMNAYDTAPKGRTYQHTLIRILTDDGIEGVAAASYANLCTVDYARQLKPLIGARISDLYLFNSGTIAGRAPQYPSILETHRHLDAAFYDIIGKIMKKPVWALIGDAGKERIPVYDSTVYFSDVLDKERGVKAISEECAEAIHSGYRGVKIKLGRGDKWMPREEGDRRDIEVVMAARTAVGSDALLMADPNYGYRGQYEAAVNLMRETRSAKLYWIEEIFPETANEFPQFRRYLRDMDKSCLVAFGEHMHNVDDITRYLSPERVVDVVQYDIRANGIVDNVAVARRCAAAGATFAAHNWASQIGYVMQLHLARALGNYGVVECDRSTCDVLRVESLPLSAGYVPAPTMPGLGISIEEDVYRAKNAPGEIVVS
jgi:L-alanine-DL-glutamate epimerase-like enolase superfamily enzyme